MSILNLTGLQLVPESTSTVCDGPIADLGMAVEMMPHEDTRIHGSCMDVENAKGWMSRVATADLEPEDNDATGL